MIELRPVSDFFSFWFSKLHFKGRVHIKSQGQSRFEPQHDKTNNVAFKPSEDSDQPGHPPNLIRVFAVRMKKA